MIYSSFVSRAEGVEFAKLPHIQAALISHTEISLLNTNGGIDNKSN